MYERTVKHERTATKWKLLERFDRSLTRAAILTGSLIGNAEAFFGIGPDATTPSAAPIARANDTTKSPRSG